MTKPKTMAIDCPNCGKKAQMSDLIKSIPQFGKTLISSLSCNECGFKFNDVMSAEFHEPKAFTAKIEEPLDLRQKIIRNSSCSIKIPELGIEVEPGPVSEGYISNIEGLLDRIESAAQAAVNGFSPEEEKKEAMDALEMIQKAKQAKFPFTVELYDPFGNSGILGKKVHEIKLTQDQVKKLKKNVKILDLKRE